MRCNSIREELILRGNEVQLINHEVVEYAKYKGHWSQYPLDRHLGDYTVIIDSYIVGVEWISENLKTCKYSVVIDDFNRITYPVDLIVNPNVFFKNLDYSNQHVNLIGGPEYILLRKCFRKQFHARIDENSILITLGGSDYRNLLPVLVNIVLEETNLPIIVVDPRNESDRIEGVQYLGFLNCNEMLQQYLSAKIVISAAGQTLHELASLKKKCIGICIDHDQVPNHNYYNHVGFIRGDIKWDSLMFEEKVKFEIQRLLSQDVPKVEGNLVNQFGVENLIEYFEKYVEL